MPLFIEAGWHTGRQVVANYEGLEHLRSFSLATEIARTFGGLQVGSCGAGRDCARSDIKFTASASAADRFAIAKLESPGDDLCPIGNAHHGNIELYLDSCGRMLAYSIPDGSLRVVGVSFWDGVERLLLGCTWTDENRPNSDAAAGRPNE
jgi:hypothetical protein